MDTAGAGNEHVVLAKFDKPIPLLGLHQQHLGVVRRLFIDFEESGLITLELKTQWQSIYVDLSAVRYDSKNGVFVLRRAGATCAGANSSE